VLSPIHFNDEQFLATDKVTDVTVDPFLPNELVSINLPMRIRFQSTLSASV